MKKIKLYLIDEIRVKFDGLGGTEINTIIERTKKYEKGYFTKATFKIGEWDGKVSFFDENGFTYFYMLDQIIPILADLGYDVDKHIDVIDYREVYELPKPISEDFLQDDGVTLRYYQKDAVNAALTHQHGIIEAGTGAGKTLVTLAISKLFDHLFGSIVIVPSETLVNQTYREYEKSTIAADSCKITKSDTPKSLRHKIETKKHFILTWQKLQNIKQEFENFVGTLIVDEVHNFGDVLANICINELSECPIRIGLTGSLPKDKQKCEKIYCHIGGEKIYEIGAERLVDEKYLSAHVIHMVQTSHKAFHQQFDQDKWDWSKEQLYIHGNRERIEAIGDYIKQLPQLNTMILCQPKFGLQLARYLETEFVHGEVPTKKREKLYERYEYSDGNLLTCSFGTSATGISMNRIFRLINIDVGKDNIMIAQSIGRALRRDGILDAVEIIDIYADSKYAKRHKRERIKFYKDKGYNYIDSKQKIFI